MLSMTFAARARIIAIACTFGCSAVLATPAAAQVTFLGTTGGYQVVCTGGSGGNILIRDNSCDVGGTGLVFPTGLQVGNAIFNDATNAVTFSGGTVSFNSATTAFGGGTASFNNPVSFTGTSVTINSDATFGNASTFNALADFNNGITSDTITNTGVINTATVSAGSVVSTSVSAAGTLSVGTGGYVDMGDNVVHFVAAGVANTDAVNVGQLNAATSGITTDVTALETLTATHSTQITALETTTATHTTQISALQAMDTALDSRLDALDALALDLDERIDIIDDRASAGTAAAVALSGAMFLPGKSFNLTGNFGTYRGAHAGALQIGALVNDKVAVNAGVAHGFNKGGKTAARVGFTIGW